MKRLANKTTISTAATNTATADNAEFQMLPLADITASATNPRREFDDASLKSLAESIRQHGILQPVLVRRTANGKSKAQSYELIAGERRLRAAKLAHLKAIPARVITLADTATLEVQIIENLQREDVHPLDEAAGFHRLKDEANLDIADIAQRVARPVSFVARRLSLVNLIEDAQDDLRRERITLAHALEIARLSTDVQPDALAACYERTSIYDKTSGEWRRTPDRSRPALHVNYLREWIADNIHLNLKKAAFALDDTRLRADGLTCIECPQRSGYNTGLFDDITNADTCLNPVCFQAKRQALINLTKAELDIRRGDGTSAPLITPYYSTRSSSSSDEPQALTCQEYQVIERRKDRCPSAERSLYTEGDEAGKVAWICRDKTCKDHLARYERATAGSRNNSSVTHITGEQTTDSQAIRNRRKQELFDMKVAEVARQRAIVEAVKTYPVPLERAQLETIAIEFYRRIPTDDGRVITELCGWSEADISTKAYHPRRCLTESESRERITKLDDTQLAQFLILCAVAHLGANHYQNRFIRQDKVIELSDERAVNYTLIDAEVRCELAAKKYHAAHQQYLEAVKGGRTDVKKPVVYETLLSSTLEASEMKQAA